MMKYTQGSHTSGPENFKVLHLHLKLFSRIKPCSPSLVE